MFISFKFTQTETRYHTTEKEALGILLVLEEYRWLIKGSDFLVKFYIDHMVLITILRGDDTRDRISRWQLRLAEYDFEIKHIPGKELAITDGLSRLKGFPAY